MSEELTMKDIEEAMKFLDEGPIKILEDDFSIIEVGPLGPKKVTLKPKGQKIIRDFIGVGEKELGEKGVINFLGVKVVKSEEDYGTHYFCEQCGKNCIVEKREDGRIKAIRCPDHPGPHASGSFSYTCGSDYCRCCQ